MKNEKNKHIQGLINYLNQDNEKANEDMVCQYFRHAFNNFTRQTDASKSDGYVSGHFILEIKGHTQDWYDGLFQAIAYKKNLDFSLVIVITKGLMGVWRVDKIPEDLVKEILGAKKAPNAIGKEFSKKYKDQRYKFQNLAEWFRDDLFGLLAPSTKDFIQIIREFESIIIAGKKVRKKITLKNFTSILNKMKMYFDTSQPIKAVRAFYTMIYAWNEDAIVQLSQRHEGQVTMNGELITNLLPDMRFDFKNFVEDHYIHLFDGEGVDDFFTRYDEAIDAVDSDFRKKNGIYFTDPFLSKFAMWFIKENIPNLGKNYIVVDPAAGSGNLVINWRSPLELRHKVVSEIEPELLFAIERRMKRDERQQGKFTIIPKVEQAKGLNFLDISASNYIDIINETLEEKNLKLDKPIAFLCNPPYRGDDDTSVKNVSYKIHSTILEVVTPEAESERYCCFLAQMKLICDHLEESGFPDDSKLLLFTKSTWLTSRKSFSSLKRALFSSFDFIDGALFDGTEFFDLKGKFPIAFTMWTYNKKKKINFQNIVNLRDLTWVKKKSLCEIDWNIHELTNTECKNILNDERSIKIPFGVDRKGIMEWSNIKRKDVIRNRRKNEIHNLYCGGLPKNDKRLKNNSVYGFCGGDSIGFMEDLTPCRTNTNVKDVPWFTLDVRFQRVRRNRCFSGPPDSRGYCAADYPSAKRLFLWYAIAKTFVDFPAPMWTDAMEIWVPDLLNNYDKQITSYSFAIGFADNDCVETIFPANNPVEGLKEIYCANPMSPNNPNSFWSVYLKGEMTNTNSVLVNALVEAVNNLYVAWKNKFNLNPEIKVTYQSAYFIDKGILTSNSGIKQIKDYVRENPDEHLNEFIDNLNKQLKRTKKEFYTYLHAKNLVNYFGINEINNESNFDVKEKRLILASTIVSNLFNSKSFGRTKFAKVFYIADMICSHDLGTTYYRAAAGPIDYEFLYNSKEKVELIASNKQYFYTDSTKKITKYRLGEKINYVNDSFNLIFSHEVCELTRMFDLFQELNTEQSEIVATLFACWNDLLIMRDEATEERIIIEAKEHWHINKLRFSDERLKTAIKWMRKNSIVPKGNKSVTKIKNNSRSNLNG